MQDLLIVDFVSHTSVLPAHNLQVFLSRVSVVNTVSHPTEFIRRRDAYVGMYDLDFRSGSDVALAMWAHILSTSKHLFS